MFKLGISHLLYCSNWCATYGSASSQLLDDAANKRQDREYNSLKSRLVQSAYGTCDSQATASCHVLTNGSHIHDPSGAGSNCHSMVHEAAEPIHHMDMSR